MPGPGELSADERAEDERLMDCVEARGDGDLVPLDLLKVTAARDVTVLDGLPVTDASLATLLLDACLVSDDTGFLGRARRAVTAAAAAVERDGDDVDDFEEVDGGGGASDFDLVVVRGLDPLVRRSVMLATRDDLLAAVAAAGGLPLFPFRGNLGVLGLPTLLTD